MLFNELNEVISLDFDFWTLLLIISRNNQLYLPNYMQIPIKDVFHLFLNIFSHATKKSIFQSICNYVSTIIFISLSAFLQMSR